MNKALTRAAPTPTNISTNSLPDIDTKGRLVGIFTDGDLRRHIESKPDLINVKVKEVMTKDPITIKKEKLAAEAFDIMRSRKIDEIPVVDDKKRPVGLLDVQDLLKAGLV